jgi:hypothetical protein
MAVRRRDDAPAPRPCSESAVPAQQDLWVLSPSAEGAPRPRHTASAGRSGSDGSGSRGVAPARARARPPTAAPWGVVMMRSTLKVPACLNPSSWSASTSWSRV